MRNRFETVPGCGERKTFAWTDGQRALNHSTIQREYHDVLAEHVRELSEIQDRFMLMTDIRCS
jgi:hypothetical protein